MKLYALIRKDLNMNKGKLASQAGHAYLNSYLNCLKKDTLRAEYYQKDGIGTKVCLEVDNITEIINYLKLTIKYNFPYSLIVDSGHVMPPHFDGEPIVTALGIGPLTPIEAEYLSELKLAR